MPRSQATICRRSATSRCALTATSRRSPAAASRRALTVIELLMSIAIMTVIAGVLAALSDAVYVGTEHSRGVGAATQHSRVALERISRSVSGAATAENEPGLVVLETTVGGYGFPDTLVVWRPSSVPANADGPPLVGELVIFCPDPEDPRRLLEITLPGDTRPAPFSQLDTAAGRKMIEDIKLSNTSKKVVLTNLLHTASLSGNATDVRGAVRFVRRVRPSTAGWGDFRNSVVAFGDLAWPQGVYGAQTGLRQVWLETELQMDQWANNADRQSPVIPYFGSSALYYELRQ